MEKEMELKYLKSLAKLYPSVAAASTEIINLQSVLNLPKGTEHFHDGYPWRVRAVFPCAEKWFRFCRKRRSMKSLEIP